MKRLTVVCVVDLATPSGDRFISVNNPSLVKILHLTRSHVMLLGAVAAPPFRIDTEPRKSAKKRGYRQLTAVQPIVETILKYVAFFSDFLTAVFTLSIGRSSLVR